MEWWNSGGASATESLQESIHAHRSHKRMKTTTRSHGGIAGIGGSWNMESVLWHRQMFGGTVVARPSFLTSRLSHQAWNPDRLHNLILAVGPGTPASVFYTASLRNRARGDEDDEDVESDEDEEAEFTWSRFNDQQEEEDEAVEENEEDEGDEEEEEAESNNEGEEDEEIEREEALFHAAAAALDAAEAEASRESREQEEEMRNEREDPFAILRAAQARERQRRQRPPPSFCWKPELRHGGCINTATWLTVPWRLAAPAGGAVVSQQNSNEGAKLLESAEGHVPTQLVTAGDDRMVKLWDARYAMGTASPLPGGWDTYCPLSSQQERPIASVFQSRWKRHYHMDEDSDPSAALNPPAGSVIPLAALPTGHRGNVFDVKPLPTQPGKFLTCAADGYLRLLDVQAQESSVVINPLELREGGGFAFFLRSGGGGLAFSHVLLTAQTGLLCSERGLHHFDLRLSPREQSRQSLLAAGGDSGSDDDDSVSASDACKACAVWRPHGNACNDEDSHFVFVGGNCARVDLYDLRMGASDGGGSSSSGRSVVQTYKPRFVRASPAGNVSVSGLDVSKDGTELLVSYESDQIYAFPIKGGSALAMASSADGEEEDAEPALMGMGSVSETMAYGGHLNRFTFLKNAKYAGNEDQYICTGSDSGHAWIFEKSTGTVVSLLSADRSTCNGVIPHPTLPMFVTYGIDSTARVWRATTPVDNATDDSSKGRAQSFMGLSKNQHKLELSPITANPVAVHLICSQFHRKTTKSKKKRGRHRLVILPDLIASKQEIAACGKFSAPNRRGMVDYDSPRIGNSLFSLPSLLRSNQYECYRDLAASASDDDDDFLTSIARRRSGGPIDSGGLRPFTVRVAMSRLRHQALQLGISSTLMSSFLLQSREPWNFGRLFSRDGPENQNEPRHHPADLVPDTPSDWILLDKNMNPHALDLDYWHWNKNKETDQSDEVQEKEGLSVSVAPVWLKDCKPAEDDLVWPVRSERAADTEEGESSGGEGEGERNEGNGTEQEEADEEGTDEGVGDDERSASLADVEFSDAAKRRSQEWLYRTALVLKEGGSAGLKEGQLASAAQRYDKAIQYCSVAFVNCGSGESLSHLQHGLSAKETPLARFPKTLSVPIVWSPLLRVLITCRLNLALVLLKPKLLVASSSAVVDAKTQAEEALRLLLPFTTRSGAVVVVSESERTRQGVDSDEEEREEYEEKQVYENEPTETYQQARALQAKAYFRLGSAEMEQGDWSAAVDSFQASIQCSASIAANGDASSGQQESFTPDALVARRLQEAKTKRNSKKKRDRKRFEVALGGAAGAEDDNVGRNKNRNKEKRPAAAKHDNVGAQGAGAAETNNDDDGSSAA